MSSRLTEQFLRDTLPQRSLDQLPRLRPEECLQWAEALLRYRWQEEPEAARQVLAHLYQRFPQWADTHYLYALGLQAQQQAPELWVPRVQKALATPLKGFTGHLWRLLAEHYLKHHQLAEAATALQKAFAQLGAQQPTFVHCVHRALPVTEQTLAFDLALFEALCPWNAASCVVKLQALAVSPQGQLWVLEVNQGWLFSFDAQGQFCYGLQEHDLADQRFLHPEYLFDLRDVAASERYLYVAGAQDQIHVFDHQGQPVRTLAAPEGRRRPLSLAANAAGDCFVLYQNHEKIHHFDAQGLYQGAFGQNTTLVTQQSSYFCGIATQSEQVLLYDQQQLQAFAPDQPKPLQHWVLPNPDLEHLPHCANGVAADAHTLWVTHTAQHQIYTGAVADKVLRPLSLKTALVWPQDVAADGRGGFYIADTGQARVLHVNAQHKITTVLAHSRFVAEKQAPHQDQRKKVSP